MKLKNLFGIAIIILAVGMVSASFSVGNLSHSIDNSYGPGDFVRGWINISLHDEPANSVFLGNNGDSITLLNLLKLNKDYSDKCSTKNCEPDYSASNAQTQKNLYMSPPAEKIYGFKFSGNINSINSIEFEVESNVGASCSNQLKIDFLNDGIVDIGNNKSSNQDCSHLKSYGCFLETIISKNFVVNANHYCQRIKLSESPSFKIGAWVKKESGDEILKMEILDEVGDVKADCELPAGSTSGGEISCDVNFLVTEANDYYVCIFSDSGEGINKIEGYSDSQNKCGFHGSNIQPEIASYKIFAMGKKFNPIGTLKISDVLQEGNQLGWLVENYIRNKYGKLDCTNGCVVPFKIISEGNQYVILKNLLINYDEDAGTTIDNKFYDLSSTIAKMNMDFEKINLDEGNFSVSDSYGDKNFNLKLNGADIFSENILIEKVPKIISLSPTSTVSSFPTEFMIFVSSDKNISEYTWEFGDREKNQTTKVNKITHTYNSTGIYEMKITVKDKDNKKSYKIFNIIVSTPNEVINVTLNKMQENLEVIKNYVEGLDSTFEKDGLTSALDLSQKNKDLIKLQKDYKSAGSNEEKLNKILSDLIELKVPESIFESKKANSVSFNINDVNLDVLKTAGGGSYSSDEKDRYLDAIVLWNNKNLDSKINFREYSAEDEHSDEAILRVFEIKFNENENLREDYYFIMKDLEELNFGDRYSEKEDSGYIYFKIRNEDKIVFSTTEEVDFSDLPAFISPALNRLSISEDSIGEGSGTNKWIIFILVMAVFLIIIGVVYWFMQEWYKSKYETYLFKNKNNLYNLLNYINRSKTKGLKNEEIRKKLKKAGWKSEQMTYAMKKYTGRKTGMTEIPINKFLNKFRKSPQPRNIKRGIRK